MARFSRAFAVVVALFSLAAYAAEPFPQHPIKMLVGFAAGGPTDQAARIVADAMGTALGQPVVVENRPGANASLSVRALAAAKADGYTVLLASNGILTVAGARYKTLPFDVKKDFVPLGSVAGYSHVLTVPTSSVAHDVKTLIANGRSAAPTIASVGNVDELTIALFRKLSGVQFRVIPYQGQSAVLNDLIAGRIDMSFLAPTVAVSLIKAGKLRALAVTGNTRIGGLPDVPTMQEAGVAGFEVEIWNALMAPRGTDPAIAAALANGLKTALAQPAVQKKLDGSGLVPLPDTPKALAEKIETEGQKWKTLAWEEQIPLLDF